MERETLGKERGFFARTSEPLLDEESGMFLQLLSSARSLRWRALPLTQFLPWQAHTMGRRARENMRAEKMGMGMNSGTAELASNPWWRETCRVSRHALKGRVDGGGQSGCTSDTLCSVCDTL